VYPRMSASLRLIHPCYRLAGVALLMGVLGGTAVFRASDARVAGGQALPARLTAGPQAAITCPAGAIVIGIEARIQDIVNRQPGETAFCLKSGVHVISSAITPKTGNTFIGEYGAIVDGTGWATTDPDQGAFRAHNQAIDDVTIRNLVIRNMPQKGIHAFYSASNRWTIEYNEVTANRTGVAAPNRSVVRNNYIHHNSGGGYSAYRAVSTTFENNDIAYNGGEQKMFGTANVIFRNNFVHQNAADGIWYDADNTGALIEGNQVDDNGREGISYEISGGAVIRNNTVRRNGTTGIFISTSKDVEIYGNTLEDNYRGIQYFLNCDAVGGGSIAFDLANNSAHDNTVMVGARSGAYANGLAHLSSCTTTQVSPYLDGAKNLAFGSTRYLVPSKAAKYWFWGLSSVKSLTDSLSWGPSSMKSWSEWQALGQDQTGMVSQ
jgi:parallel beta-helix repeat protein